MEEEKTNALEMAAQENEEGKEEKAEEIGLFLRRVFTHRYQIKVKSTLVC